MATTTGTRTIPAKLLACLFLVGVADWFFYKEPVGWVAGVFIVLALAALCLFHDGWKKTNAGKAVAFLLCGLAATLVEETGILRAVMACLGLATLLVLEKRGGLQDGAVWVKDVLFLALRIPRQWMRDSRLAQRIKAKGRRAKPLCMPSVYRAMPPLLMALVFVLLFKSANPLISYYLAKLNFSIELREFLEDVGELVGRHADTGIDHPEHDLAVFFAGLHAHRSALGELDCIADEVEDDLADAQFVANAFGHVRGDIYVEPDTLGLGIGFEQARAAAYDMPEIHRFAGQLHPAGLDLRQVEQFVQQA